MRCKYNDCGWCYHDNPPSGDAECVGKECPLFEDDGRGKFEATDVKVFVDGQEIKPIDQHLWKWKEED